MPTQKTKIFSESRGFRKGIQGQSKRKFRPRILKRLPLKIIPLGGLEEVGRNMILLEYGSDIIVVDMGLEFPKEDMPGIDYIIPDIRYLKGKEQNIRGVFITHGHYDHIGAIPHLIPQLGNPQIYTGDLTKAIIEKRQEEYQGKSKLKIKVIDSKSKVRVGVFQVEFFRVSHNIPNCFGLIIYTPQGIVVHTGDFKLDFNPAGSEIPEISKIASLNSKNVLALLSDSTNASLPGHQLSEKEIEKNLEHIFLKARGRIIISTFSSLISRIQQIISLAEKLGRKVLIEGYSMKINLEIAQSLNYLKIKKRTLISLEESLRLPPKKIIIICTGAQAEEKAVLVRIAQEEHRFLKIIKGDTVIFSSSVVPGNERTVEHLKDTLWRKGAEVVHYQMMDVHAGGHAKQEDLKLMIRLINPKYIVPIQGNLSLLKAQAMIAEELGFNKGNILIAENGRIIEFSRGLGKVTSQKVSSDYIMVDGLGVGDVSQVVLRDRQVLASDGMVVIIATIESRTGKLVGNPDIISRGFVYMRESKELIENVRKKVKKLLRDKDPRSEANQAYLKDKIRDSIGQFLFSKTQRRPMILPVIISV
jgi:ribonuclease J